MKRENLILNYGQLSQVFDRYLKVHINTRMYFSVCIGACIFGIIINWAGAAIYHMDSLTYSKYRKNTDHAWLVCYALIGATAGVIPWAFLTEKMGRKSTLLFQGPCLLICWFIMGYFNNYKIYTIAHGFSGFFGICYMFAGEAYLIETIHRHYMKTMFTVFRASFLLGVTIDQCCGKFARIKFLKKA